MPVRIFSQVVCPAMMIIAASATAALSCHNASAQSGGGLYTDPATGIAYQKVMRTVTRPVVETRVEPKTVYRPQTVTECQPKVRTVYTPVVEYKWEPRVHGRWNPFRSPTVAYHNVAKARWEPRNEVVQQTTSRTEWVAETRNVPRNIARMETVTEENFEPLGEVAPLRASPPGPSQALASRLRPLAANERIVPSGSAPRIASSTVGRTTSDPPRRNLQQGGMRTTTLEPQNIYSQPLAPATSGIATTPSLPTFLR